MDAKITLSFDAEVISSAKKFAETHNISLSRLTEHLYRQITSGAYTDLEALPVSEWVSQVAEGPAVYKATPPKRLKEEYYKSRER